MLHIPDLAPRGYAYTKAYSTECLKCICLIVYEVRPQNAIDRKKENGTLECKWRTEKNKNVSHWKKCILFKH